MYMYCVARIGGTLWNRRVIIISMSEITMLGQSSDKKKGIGVEKLSVTKLHVSASATSIFVSVFSCAMKSYAYVISG